MYFRQGPAGSRDKGGGGGAVDIDDGNFEFDNVPYGRHVLLAEDCGKGGIKGEGKLEVELDDSTESQTILVK